PYKKHSLKVNTRIFIFLVSTLWGVYQSLGVVFYFLLLSLLFIIITTSPASAIASVNDSNTVMLYPFWG
ncbi:hypothetical protein, partial [Listeria booriae]|uniref:hypothetical protein n=1 Tax=Listeria booriae TaxID=1552123 RepID=UPI001C894F72